MHTTRKDANKHYEHLCNLIVVKATIATIGVVVQIVPTSFIESFPGWKEGHDAVPHPKEPCINWKDLASLEMGPDEATDSEAEEDDLRDADSHVPLNEAARQVLGDGPTPEMVIPIDT